MRLRSRARPACPTPRCATTTSTGRACRGTRRTPAWPASSGPSSPRAAAARVRGRRAAPRLRPRARRRARERRRAHRGRAGCGRLQRRQRDAAHRARHGARAHPRRRARAPSRWSRASGGRATSGTCSRRSRPPPSASASGRPRTSRRECTSSPPRRSGHSGLSASGVRASADARRRGVGEARGDGHHRRPLLDPARSRRPLRPLQRPGVRGHQGRGCAPAAMRPLPLRTRRSAEWRALHDRGRAVTGRRCSESRRRGHRRGRQPPARPAAAVPVRGALLARRLDPRSLLCRRRPPAHRRPQRRPPAARPRRRRASAGLGARRAPRRGDVELELGDRLAAGDGGPAGRPDTAP